MTTQIDTRTSRTPFEDLVGRKAVADLYDGPRVGTLEMPSPYSGGQMVVRFDDGRWAHAGITITLAD